MSFIRNIFSQKKNPVHPHQAFWTWFSKHERAFFETVKSGENIDENFFEALSPKLDEVKEGIFFLTGMHDDNTAELILTPDGTIKNIVFVEELVNAAPKLKDWKFIALKPASNIPDMSVEMSAYSFNKDTLFFYANDNSTYPDQIDVTIIHSDFNEDNREIITNGVYIFLDNYIGELASITMIDDITVVSKEEAQKELVPIEKLGSFLAWREKEFVEKYQETRRNTENDTYSALEAKLKSGNYLVAVVNTGLLEWDAKASHPWIASIELKYDGDNTSGMPNKKTYELLEKIEEDILENLKDYEGYLNIGRQTADNTREIYFACKDFRLPAKVLNDIQERFSDVFDIEYDIYKDKYWQSFERFQTT
ncbi:DUF695 domain-containing protein [Hymenobacter sp. BT635]|uniref:DUF695 domain-containing protein n=1 Tax=Hymenobacter nitidus TaxID=2880929 RepID=A0ABS8AHI9_9BACT|nr:DUF695 domain-containing protein [Hymenobacter nitidus]MCB2379903.1 DUF695 domain-containing protein [Hymenobacter nitidus]